MPARSRYEGVSSRYMSISVFVRRWCAKVRGLHAHLKSPSSFSWYHNVVVAFCRLFSQDTVAELEMGMQTQADTNMRCSIFDQDTGKYANCLGGGGGGCCA
jgi:hypothetical protein